MTLRILSLFLMTCLLLIVMDASACGVSEDMFGVVLTSEHSVYTVGEPIDLTVWVRRQDALMVPDLEVRDSHGNHIRKRDAEGKALFSLNDRDDAGRLTPGRNYLEAIPDLRRFFDITTPGLYSIRFVGDVGGRPHAVVSDAMSFHVREKAHPSDRVIPLSDIWALDMPGTKPMNRTLRGEPLAYEAPEGALLSEIVAALNYDPRRRPVVGECFAVEGQGLEALRAAHKVLVEGGSKQIKFRQGQQISLVFYSLSFNSYVHLAHVEQRPDTIQLTYLLVPHKTKEMTAHLALIPVFIPASVLVRVEVKPSMTDGLAAVDWGKWPKEIVCSSFAFNLTTSK